MANNRQTSPRYLAAHGLLMLCLGMAVCALGALMADPAFDRLGYAVAVFLVASSLLVACGALGILIHGERSHRPATTYLAGATSISCWLVFWLIRSAPLDLRLLSLLAGLHGLLWSLWYVRLALHFRVYPAKAALLWILAATTSFLGIVLGTQSQLTLLGAVTTAAYFMMFIGAQILLAAAYFHRECESTAGLELSAAQGSAATASAKNATTRPARQTAGQFASEGHHLGATID